MTDQQLQDNRLRIGQRLKEARTEMQMTQEDVAKKSGILRANIARIEAGKYNSSIDTLYRFAIAIGHRIEVVEMSSTEIMLNTLKK
jgi:transcriptional regulator with XRE-family HTH domain